MKRAAVHVLAALSLGAAQPPRSPELQKSLKVDAPAVALVHVRIVDGTGAPAREDQTVLLRQGRIEAMGPVLAFPKDAVVLDLQGRTVLPGLVGMHNHLFYTHSIHSDEKGAAPPSRRRTGAG
jgi:imidazolonepropionase-like amidohydrolase